MESVLLLLSAALIALVFSLLWRVNRQRSANNDRLSSRNDRKEKNPYTSIEPLVGFDWKTTEPIKIRPFKPKYHLTMGLETINLSNLIEMDNTYHDRMLLRQKLINDHLAATVQTNPVSAPAVLELYTWLTTTYLPTRFPSIYTLHPTTLHNSASNTSLPLTPSTPTAALRLLGEHIDTDFLILLPSSRAADGSPIYHLEAFVTCFPSGFSPLEKLSLPLASIHKPVPGYASKLEKSMDRFFARVECGKAYRRVNWTVTTDDLLFVQAGNHMYAAGAGDDEDDEDRLERKANAKTLDVSGSAAELDAEIERQRRGVEVDACRLRCERQTLHRLPQTQALVFAFKTYQYKLGDVRAEGSGPAMAEAIEGLGLGNVDMTIYKRGVVWGEKVRQFLVQEV